jgi:dGTPase
MSVPAGYTDHDAERRGDHESATSSRQPFEVDKGRIIHSAAFRRLQGKTQVLGVGERDFYRTRLTHSLEVAQLGRGICGEVDREFQPDQDLVEVICLGHDIGHPPFGHSGEEYLLKRMSEHGGFGANPQNIRVVTLLEAKYPDFGLDLSRATLDGLIKYPTIYDPALHTKSGKFTYKEDAALLAWIKEGVADPTLIPLEGQIADWADQMAYSVNDIEDGVRGGLLDFNEIRLHRDEIEKSAAKSAAKDFQKLGLSTEAVDREISPAAIVGLCGSLEECCARPTSLRERKENLKAWTSATIKKLKSGCRIKVRSGQETSPRYRFGFHIAPEAICEAAILKALVRILVLDHPRVRTLESKGCTILAAIFHKLIHDPALLPLDFQELLRFQKYGSKPRIIADFISGTSVPDVPR